MIHWRNRQPWRAEKLSQRMNDKLLIAFSEACVLDNALLVVWTKGQMRGIRAHLLRTKLDDHQHSTPRD